MNRSDFSFQPHSDMNADSESVVRRHAEKIKEKCYSAAVSILDESGYQDGFRASLFQSLQDRIRRFQIYIMNQFNDDPDIYFSLNEPTPEQMEGKKFWIQPYV